MKNTLLIIALLWALAASGQIYINSFTFGAAPPATLLLDDYPNAAAAYSLRLLRTAYTGDCIEVRRASDNATSNIGFSGGVIDTTTLKTFCASTDCFVRTWYDQSGNANNAVQTNTSLQPAIITSGAVIRQGTTPAIRFPNNATLQANDANSLSFTDGSGTDLPMTWVGVFSTNTQTGNRILFAKDQASPNREYAVGYFSDNELRFFLKNGGGNNQISRDNKDLGQVPEYQISVGIYDASEVSSGISIYWQGAAATMGDAVNQTYTGMANTTAVFTIGSYIGNTSLWNGDIQEIVLWATDFTSSVSTLQSDINSFYNAY